MVRSRVRVYLVVRVLAAVAFLVGALVLPRGVPAGLLVVAAGVAALLSAMWSNAGSPGERAGARQQDRWFDSVMPPQGDWPPYEPGPSAPHPASAVPPAPAAPPSGTPPSAPPAAASRPVLRRGEPGA